MFYGSPNGVVAVTVRQYFAHAVAYLFNPTPRGSQVQADQMERVEVVDGPKLVHIDDAFQGEYAADNDAPQPVPTRARTLQRNNTIICAQFADQFVPPTIGDDFHPKPAEEAQGAFAFSTVPAAAGTPGPAPVFGSLTSAANPLLRRASDHVFSIGSSMTEMRERLGDGDSSDDGFIDETFNDSTSESDFSETDIDIDALHESCQAQDVAQENRNSEDSSKKEYPVVDVIDNQPYCRIGKVLLLAPSAYSSFKRTRSEYDDEDIPTRFTTPEDDLPPRARYYRKCRRNYERRRVEVEPLFVDTLRDIFPMNSNVFKVQEKPGGVRMAHLGRDGLDDAPTPPGSPMRKRRRIL